MTTQEELTSGHWLTLSLDSCQLFVMTCELLRQETDHLVTTHTPTQVTTEAVDRGQSTQLSLNCVGVQVSKVIVSVSHVKCKQSVTPYSYRH